jgi:hypothetical protein
MSPDDPGRRLLAQEMAEYAVSEVESKGFSLSPPAQQRLHNFVVGPLLEPGPSSDLVLQDLERMRGSVAELAYQIVREGSDGPGFDTTINENIVRSVIARLCPGFWPFC